MERELIGLEGLIDAQTFAIESTVALVLEFSPSIDIDEAMVDVREKVDTAQAEFPDDTEEPRITQFNTATDNILRLDPAARHFWYCAGAHVDPAHARTVNRDRWSDISR